MDDVLTIGWTDKRSSSPILSEKNDGREFLLSDSGCGGGVPEKTDVNASPKRFAPAIGDAMDEPALFFSEELFSLKDRAPKKW